MANDEGDSAETFPLPYEVARSDTHAALAELERSMYAMGYDQGFNAGWDAAVRRLSAVSMEKPTVSAPSLADLDVPAKEVVLQVIERSPGLRGVEIVDAAARSGSPVHERAVRTALHRLKSAGRIKNEDGKWFPLADQLKS
jgi:hypothetical protein